MVKKFSNADDRPRIYIRKALSWGFGWSIGLKGPPHFEDTPGKAVDAALSEIGNVDAVIFYSGNGG